MHSSSTEDCILASGVIVYVDSGEQLDFLVLHTAHRPHLDWPKGVVEARDGGYFGLWAAAKRELYEETSIDLDSLPSEPRSPYWYEYRLPNGSLKRVCLFPVKVFSRPTVETSEEHIGFEWLDSRRVLQSGLSPEQRGVVLSLLSDIEWQLTHAVDRASTLVRLKHIVPQAVTAVDEASACSWYWYGSWLNDEQATLPRILSDIDLVCLGRGIPSSTSIAKNRQTITDVVERSLHRKVSCSVHYVDVADGGLHRSPQWTYFLATNRSVARAASALPEFDAERLIDSEPDPYNELARVCWYRLHVDSVATAEQAAYSFAKGVLFLPLLMSSGLSGYSFLGYRRYFGDLLASRVLESDRRVPPLDLLLRAIDEKVGSRALSLRDEWRRAFCQAASASLPLSMDAQTYEGRSGVFCSACLEMIQGNLLAAKSLSLTLGADIRQLRGQMRLLASHQPTEELRLSLLCFLGAFRCLLWPRDMKFAVDNVRRSIANWTRELGDMGSAHGVAFATACAQSLRSVEN